MVARLLLIASSAFCVTSSRKRDFEDDAYWHMVGDALIEFVCYLTGPLITAVWELIGVAEPSKGNRRRADAGSHLQRFLFYGAERSFVSSFIKRVTSPKRSPFFIGISNYLPLIRGNEGLRRSPTASCFRFSSFLTRLQFPFDGLKAPQRFAVKLAEESARRRRHSAAGDEKREIRHLCERGGRPGLKPLPAH